MLSAFVIPSIGDYHYTWKLISPLPVEDVGIVEGNNEPQIYLSKLKAGNYTFQVQVFESDVNGTVLATGNATGSLIVLPVKIANRPPVAIVEPAESTVQLPNKDTFLDGSHSTDDNKIVRYDWKAIKVPIGYGSVSMPNVSILQLKDLIPGLYLINLTVTDSNNVSDTTTAKLTVLKEIDYPPTANAGADIVLNIPQTEVTLHGNGSVDDKGIITWQWTRTDEGSNSIDMNGTSTPHLHLSKLTVGLYKFQLQVADKSGQTARDEIIVLVKPENNKPPVAQTGGELRVVLPLKKAIVLDGSSSTDDVAIIRWLWRFEAGPKNVTIIGSNSSMATIEKIIPGRYNFSLTVWDARNLSNTAFKMIDVVQLTIIPPKANAGGDRVISLTSDIVMLNGSTSSDDGEIVAYHWERMPLSLAAGVILEHSDNTSILRLSGLVVGRYLFKLTVVDNQGATASDVASVIVKPSADQIDQLEAVLNYDLQAFTLEQQISVYKQLEEVFGEGAQLEHISLERTTDRRPVLIFSVHKDGQLVHAGGVIKRLRRRLKANQSLSLVVDTLETVVCQNNCSGHGRCQERTKRCLCEAFWMENFWRFHFDGEGNCGKFSCRPSSCEINLSLVFIDWSILYVTLICVAILLLCSGFFWFLICLIANYANDEAYISNRSSRGKQNNRTPSGAGGTINLASSSALSGGRYRRLNRNRYTLVGSGGAGTGDGSDLVELLPNGNKHHTNQHVL